MKKRQAVLIIVISVLITFVLNIVAGHWLMAKISTMPLLNRWKILSPEAPIVITNQQTIRVSDSGDAIQAAQQIKSKISTLVLVNGNVDTVVGNAINLTSDGSFAGASLSFANKVGNLFVVLSDGTTARVATTTEDLATGLTFFKAVLNNVPVASFGNSADLSVGEKVLFEQNSLQNFKDRAITSAVNISQEDIAGHVFLSDYPSRGFNAPSPAQLASGEVVANTNGEIVGIWNGNQIISSDVLKNALDLYFNENGLILRPSLGFSYSIVTQNDSGLTGQSQGALVKEVAPSSAAHQAGLLVGDTITSVAGQAISESSPLEQNLEKFKPGDVIQLNVVRGKQNLTLNLTAGQLK